MPVKQLFWVLVVLSLMVLLVNNLSLETVLRRVYPLYYTTVIAEESEKNGIDPFLVAAVIHVESRWQSSAVSPKGAAGLMQLMPDTARWVAVQVRADYSPDALMDPAANILLGAWYLSYLLEIFPTLPAALAAYNAGQGNVRRWLADGRWDGSLKTVDCVPFRETRTYIRRVTHIRDFYTRLYNSDWNQGEETARSL